MLRSTCHISWWRYSTNLLLVNRKKEKVEEKIQKRSLVVHLLTSYCVADDAEPWENTDSHKVVETNSNLIEETPMDS